MALVTGPLSTCGHDLEVIGDGMFHLEDHCFDGMFYLLRTFGLFMRTLHLDG
jgi:hypothetical protein